MNLLLKFYLSLIGFITISLFFLAVCPIDLKLGHIYVNELLRLFRHLSRLSNPQKRIYRKNATSSRYQGCATSFQSTNSTASDDKASKTAAVHYADNTALNGYVSNIPYQESLVITSQADKAMYYSDECNGKESSSESDSGEECSSDDDESNNYLSSSSGFEIVDHVGRSRNKMLQRISESSIPYFEQAEVINLTMNALSNIVDDEVTKRFASVEELDVWNLLTRNRHLNPVHNPIVWLVWIIGFIFRYTILFPCRLLILVIGLSYGVVFATIVALTSVLLKSTSNASFRHRLRRSMSRIFFRFGREVISAVVRFHNPENKATPGSICVANHTSPIDVVILSMDGNYALTGQRQGGFFGAMERLLTIGGDSIWFDRSRAGDRSSVLNELNKYVQYGLDGYTDGRLPVLLFPEGTCINNTGVMMFRKGSFAIDVPIYPVAIKYDARLGDPFWNSRRFGLFHFILRMMSSWALAVDVYYLPRMERMPTESTLDFANRVKAAIAHRGGFVNLDWDGMLKRTRPKDELRQLEQLKISKRFKSE